MKNDPRPGSAAFALALREWQLELYGAGKLTMVGDGTAVTSEVIQAWRAEIDELRRVADPS